jgi:hypothetical protein
MTKTKPEFAPFYLIFGFWCGGNDAYVLNEKPYDHTDGVVNEIAQDIYDGQFSAETISHVLMISPSEGLCSDVSAQVAEAMSGIAHSGGSDTPEQAAYFMDKHYNFVGNYPEPKFEEAAA